MAGMAGGAGAGGSSKAGARASTTGAGGRTAGRGTTGCTVGTEAGGGGGSRAPGAGCRTPRRRAASCPCAPWAPARRRASPSSWWALRQEPERASRPLQRGLAPRPSNGSWRGPRRLLPARRPRDA